MALKNTLIFLLSSSKSRGKCFHQFYLNKIFWTKCQGTLDRSWNGLSTCICSSSRCLGDLYIHATDSQLQALPAGQCFITVKEAKSPLTKGFDISWDQDRGKKHGYLKCVQGPRKDQKIQHSVLLPCNNSKSLLKLPATKLPVEKSSEPPRNKLSERHHPLQLWWKHSAYSTARSQVAALKTLPGGHTQRHHHHYLLSTRSTPNWRGKGAYFALFLLLKTVFVPRSTVRKTKMAVSPSRCSWARAQPPRQPCQTRTLLSSAGMGSMP